MDELSQKYFRIHQNVSIYWQFCELDDQSRATNR